jgi:hemin uptake protein HemP
MDVEHTPKKSGDDGIVDSVAVRAQRKVPSGALLGDRGELIIVHAGREYRLRLTQNGKLILTA